MLLIVFAKQSPALRDAPQAVDFAQRGAARWGIDPPQAGSEQQQTSGDQPGGKDDRPNQAEIKEQERGDDQDRFAQTVRAVQGMFFRALPTDLPQLYLLALFAANGGLGGRGAFQGVALRLLAIVAQAMTVKGDDQRQAIGGDQLNAVFVIDMLFPERRQMDLHRIEKIAPFIRRVGGDPVAGNGPRHRVDGVALFIQRQSDGRAGCA